MASRIKTIRRSWKIDDKQPILVIVDSIQKVMSGSKSLDNSENATLRVTKVTTDLKQLAVRENAAVVAISEIQQRSNATVNDSGSLEEDCYRDSFAVNHIADVAMAIQTSTVPAKGKVSEKDQLSLYLEKRKSTDMISESALRKAYPLDDKDSVYARASFFYVRGGAKDEAAFVYKKSTQEFTPIDPSKGSLD